MAVDIASVCSVATDSQGSQTLAIVLSIMFSLYTIVTIALSALTIYSTSQALAPAQIQGTVAGGVIMPRGSSVGAPPLVGLRSQ